MENPGGSGSSEYTTDCHGKLWIGGPSSKFRKDGEFERTFTGLEPHKFVFLSVRLEIFDNSETSDYVEVRIDNTRVSVNILNLMILLCIASIYISF